jgi:phosphoribosylformimino-5-aminoimidazole carboxamide ribotide isomerase
LKSRQLIIPSIDISGGRIASIRQHEIVGFDTRFKDPVEAALFWAGRGARRIHLIDLDGSKAGHPVNIGVVEAISRAVPVLIQAGGGVRNPMDVELLKRAGADLVIFRPRACEGEDLESFRSVHGIILAFDLTAGLQPGEVMNLLPSCISTTGAKSILICDVTVEGTAGGPRISLLGPLLRDLGASWPDLFGGLEMIYAGGISTKQDLEALSSIGFSAVVVGAALYRGSLDLSEVS